MFDSLQGVLGGEGPRIDRYGISDDDAYAVGLTCGGTIEVLVDVLGVDDRGAIDAVHREIDSERPVATVTLVDSPRGHEPGGLAMAQRRAVVAADGVKVGAPWLTRQIVATASEMLADGRSGLVDLNASDVAASPSKVFVDVWRPRPRMIVFGSTQIATELARQGSGLGYRVTVCDARAVFATPGRFPDADEVVVDWPHRYIKAESEAGRIDGRTVVCVLTHDAKFEIPLLRYLLAECPPSTRPGFVGAMGSRRTHRDREARLAAEGVTLEQQAMLASPFGLDLGGVTAAETALSMAAEIVAWQRGGTGARLSKTVGDIHRGSVGVLPTYA